MKLHQLFAATLGVASAFAAVSPATAQTSSNVTLLGNLGGRSFYNDIWGYAAPNGDEYAIVGTRNGTVFVNASNPSSLQEVAFIPGPTSTWRDIRTYSTYAYIVTEGGGGMQVVDLSNPQTPSLVGTVSANRWGNAHNICLDTSTGWIYVVGTNNGLVVLDASANPTNPTFVGTVPGPYIHDMHVENGLAHVAALRDGEYEIWDVTSFPFTVLSQSTTAGSFTHNCWPNVAQTVAVTTDEISGGVVQVWDTSNLAAPVARSTYTANPAAIPHNAFIVGDVCHISFYTEGYRAVSLADPSNPVEIAFYDTFGGASGGTSGAWGCYPFQPSGRIYISDTVSGLFVLQINDLDVTHSPLADTVDELGPYVVTASVSSSSAIASVQLDYSVDGGANQSLAMTPTGTPGQYSASIPGQNAPSNVRYSITATNGIGSATIPATGEYSFTVGTVTRVFFDDFENGVGGWTSAQVLRQDDWQYGRPAGRSGTSSGVAWADPASAFSGNNCWGNDLGIGNFNGAYQPNVSNWLQSPPIPTGGAQGLKLRFRRWVTVEDAVFDQTRVFVNGQEVWSNPTGSNLVDTSWVLTEVDISSIANTASSIDIRFTLESDGGLNLGGWAIDDLEVLALSDCVPAEIYGVATPGTGSIPPVISTSGTPNFGSTNFRVDGSGMLGGSPAFLVLGFGRATIPALGITLHVNPVVVTRSTMTTGGAGVPAIGTASLPFSIPADPTLDGVDFFVQWFVADAGGRSGFLSTSPGARVRICAN